MPWPTRIARQFQIIPAHGTETDLHGPYNKLLNHLFPPESEFTVVPRSHFWMTAKQRQPKTETDRPAPQLGFMVFEVQYENLPVLLVLLTTPTVLQSPLAREMADAQMRGQLLSQAGLCPLNNLRGISAFGTRLCFFAADTAGQKPEIYPSAIIKDTDAGPEDVAPLERWAIDLLSQEGEAHLREIVGNIKLECETETGPQNNSDARMAEN